MTLKFAPWSEDPLFELDDVNEGHIWKHKVNVFEVEECFENAYTIKPHKQAKSQPRRYGDRYLVEGITDGGRKLIIIVQHKGAIELRKSNGNMINWFHETPWNPNTT